MVALATLCADRASAQEKHFGAWVVGLLGENEGVYAQTTNDSGGVLGEYCYKKEATCVWALANDVKCEQGSKYTVLVNSDAGAVSMEIACLVLDGKAFYAFAHFDSIDGIARNASRVGIAFPMKNGLFQVSRFSLDGASSALALTKKVGEKMVEKANTSSTVDRTF
jgi:hypothetical protein